MVRLISVFVLLLVVCLHGSTWMSPPAAVSASSNQFVPYWELSDCDKDKIQRMFLYSCNPAFFFTKRSASISTSDIEHASTQMNAFGAQVKRFIDSVDRYFKNPKYLDSELAPPPAAQPLEPQPKPRYYQPSEFWASVVYPNGIEPKHATLKDTAGYYLNRYADVAKNTPETSAPTTAAAPTTPSPQWKRNIASEYDRDVVQLILTCCSPGGCDKEQFFILQIKHRICETV